MLIEQYFSETRPAVLHTLSALAEYDQATPPPSLSDYANGAGVVRMDRSEMAKYLMGIHTSLALDMAKATLCGALLQVAFTAINLFPRSDALPEDLGSFEIKPGTKAARFCVGRKVCGIPSGLLVYAGRIQYNHWDERQLNNKIALSVLGALREFYRDDPSFDLAYAWDWPGPRPIAHHIVRHEFRWQTYDDYSSDLKPLLQHNTQTPEQALRSLRYSDE